MQIRMEKKLLSLFTGELFAVIMFAVLWVMYAQMMDWSRPYLTSYASIYAFVLLELILLQGSYYWLIKWKRTKQSENTQLAKRELKLFNIFKKANLILIMLGIIAMIYQIIVFPIEFYWFLFLYAFAIIEYINYYHIRLSYQSIGELRELRQGGFRRSKLARELKGL